MTVGITCAACGVVRVHTCVCVCHVQIGIAVFIFSELIMKAIKKILVKHTNYN